MADDQKLSILISLVDELTGLIRGVCAPPDPPGADATNEPVEEKDSDH